MLVGYPREQGNCSHGVQAVLHTRYLSIVAFQCCSLLLPGRYKFNSVCWVPDGVRLWFGDLVDLSSYLVMAGSVAGSLSSILATDFSSHRFRDLPHVRRINNLVSKWFQGDIGSAWQDIYLLEYFEKHLREIEGARPEVLQVFRREFRRAKLESQFFGLRFEAYVAASLLRKGIGFAKTESPDFTLEGISCCIECTTTRVDDETSKNLSYKVTSAIRKKADSASHRSDCVLFIDVTNLLHTSLLATANTIREETRLALSGTDFGAAVLFAHMFDSGRGRVQTVYFREDNYTVGGGLLRFLDDFYPVSKNRSYAFSFPPGG